LTTREDLFELGRHRLRDRSPSPDLDSRLLLQWVTGTTDSGFYSHPHSPVSDREKKRFLSLLKDRMEGTPLAYLTGLKEFWSLDLEVNRSILIPRPETELLVEIALQKSAGEDRIADIGTGSGNISAAIASSLPLAFVTATDVSKRALKVAKRNFVSLGLRNVRLLHGPLFRPLRTQLSGLRFDLILSNPPYIPEREWHNLPLGIRDHEPKTALVPGPTGLEIIEKLIKGAPDFLKPGGFLIFEMGLGQKDPVLSLFSGAWKSITCHDDLAGIPRVIEAQIS
jgi:release factor glutamine methyltransferase